MIAADYVTNKKVPRGPRGKTGGRWGDHAKNGKDAIPGCGFSGGGRIPNMPLPTDDVNEIPQAAFQTRRKRGRPGRFAQFPEFT
ncbi:hypothetical protein MyNCGM121_16860 [Achromobacter xylosoxidans]